MFTVNDTLRADGWAITVEAIVGDLNSGLLAQLTNLSEGLINGLVAV